MFYLTYVSKNLNKELVLQQFGGKFTKTIKKK